MLSLFYVRDVTKDLLYGIFIIDVIPIMMAV